MCNLVAQLVHASLRRTHLKREHLIERTYLPEAGHAPPVIVPLARGDPLRVEDGPPAPGTRVPPAGVPADGGGVGDGPDGPRARRVGRDSLRFGGERRVPDLGVAQLAVDHVVEADEDLKDEDTPILNSPFSFHYVFANFFEDIKTLKNGKIELSNETFHL